MIKKIWNILTRSDNQEKIANSISDIQKRLDLIEKDLEKHALLITQIATIQAELINQAKYIVDSVNSENIDSIFMNTLYPGCDDDIIN